MSDKFNGQIWMGGSVSRTQKSASDPDMSVLEMFIGMIENAGVSDDWGDATVNIKSEKDFKDHLDDDGLLNFKDSQARNGMFEELEDFCREEGIPYIRVSDSYAEYDAEEIWWLPGMEVPDERYLSSDESPMIMMESFIPVKELLASALNDKIRQQSSWDKVRSALAKLNELDKSPPNLPKFEVIE